LWKFKMTTRWSYQLFLTVHCDLVQ